MNSSRMEDKGLLPIKKICNDIESFKITLEEKFESLKINEKEHDVIGFKKTLGVMLDNLIVQVDRFPALRVDATLDEEILRDDRKREIDKQASAELSERERTLAAYRDKEYEVDKKREEKKDERWLIEAATQSKLSELPVVKIVQEETTWCTRIFCCLFPETQKKLEDINSEKLQKQQENDAAFQKIELEKEKLKQEMKNKTVIDYKVFDKIIDEKVVVGNARAEAQVKAERGYNAYKYTVSEDLMMLLIRLNSCVRRIDSNFTDYIKKSINENTPLKDEETIKQTKEFLKSFDKELNEQCKLLCCVDPDDATHKIYFSAFYERYTSQFGQTEKLNILDGGSSDKTPEARAKTKAFLARVQQKIFSWDLPPTPVNIPESVTAVSHSLKRGSSRRI